jgi:hypothetical protein
MEQLFTLYPMLVGLKIMGWSLFLDLPMAALARALNAQYTEEAQQKINRLSSRVLQSSISFAGHETSV